MARSVAVGRNGILLRSIAVVFCTAVALAGSYVAVRAFATSIEPFALGTVRIEIEPTLDGGVDVYVPIVDWGVRAEPFAAPLAVNLRFRSLDRAAAQGALRSGSEARQALSRLRDELAQAVRASLLRAGALAVAGGIVGGALAGGLVGALARRRRWIGYGAAVGLAVAAVSSLLALLQVNAIDYGAFQRPTFYAQGHELPRLLSLSEELPEASESYTESYEQALAGLANLVAFAGRREVAGSGGRSALVGSDLHSNALVLPVIERYGRGKLVFFVGDFTLLGTRYERRFAAEIAALGSPLVAVSGNHDARPFMRALARAGATVLTRDGRLRADGSTDGAPVSRIAGLAVAGYDDPLEGRSEVLNARPLELEREELDDEARRFVSWFEALEPRPDVVLVHQHALAHALLAAQPENTRSRLLILTGHDHKQHVEQRGAALLVDGGTVGAGGPLAIGEQSVGLIELRLRGTGPDVRALDLIEVEPLSGEAVARRVVPDSPAVD